MSARTHRTLVNLTAMLLVATLLALAVLAIVGDEPAGARISDKRASVGTYDREWRNKVSTRNKRWAKRVAECESGSDPDAIGGGGRYRGAFQFAWYTWRHAPRSPGGDPIRFSWKTQGFVAVRTMKRDGKDTWPNCG